MMIKRVIRSLALLLFLLARLSGHSQDVVTWATACPADNPNLNPNHDCWDVEFYVPPGPPATASSFATMQCDNGYSDSAATAITAQCSVAVSWSRTLTLSLTTDHHGEGFPQPRIFTASVMDSFLA